MGMAKFRGDAELEALVSALEERWRDGRPLIRTFQSGDQVRGLCAECGLERVERVGVLVDDGGLGDRTLDDLSDIMPCRRSSCGARLDYRIG